ncbi:hypothetical protein BKA56DRAFT_597843 [Ilyonectria sp. MPI-CAGE-AT-0026]|nr:hypothetical protein BKA56DRAFT_597843 [Ilyonectria sp. MPI-CAGE-AT-0026]
MSLLTLYGKDPREQGDLLRISRQVETRAHLQHAGLQWSLVWLSFQLPLTTTL